jgi:regulator of protease activity HflC (stomatin/prohibitin superfamily)
MLFLKYLQYAAGSGLLFLAAAIVLFDLVQWWVRRESSFGVTSKPSPPLEVRWLLAVKLGVAGFIPFLTASSIAVVPSGFAGVRVSQFSGTRPGTLYPGVHFVKPLVESVAVYDTRDRIFSTGGEATTETKEAKKDEAAARPDLLQVQSKEGLRVGLGVSVRFAIDPKRLDHIHAELPQPIEVEIVPPVVANAFRQLTPAYSVREVFATKREEIRQKATEAIVGRLAADGVLVKEVMLRDIVLPAEFARGLEQLLVKEQENDRLNLEIEIKTKEVRTAELAAEAEKRALIKEAEAQAEVKVLQAKAEADAMKFTLPLKEKQIEQSRLEAQARKESTLQNAEAAAEAKVIDSKAELERRKLLAEAEGNRIRVTAAADAERLRLEAVVLKQNPLLIQKIIAERLSDKLQIMMVPGDGKNFFLNDVLRSALVTAAEEPKETGSARPPQ